MKTLEELQQLEQSRFGRPRPRHGLKLLYWFANGCLSLTQNNILQLCCCPENGDFGFHIFENRDEKHSGKLLPDVNFPYYELGNLRKISSYDLPRYVREHHTGFQDNSNMDRIIISINNKSCPTVYVTEHSNYSNFNKHATYCISKRLIRIIRGLNLDDFLLKTGYFKMQINSFPTSTVELSNQQPRCSTNRQPAPPTTSTCSPVRDTCVNKDIHTEIGSVSFLVENSTQGHPKAPAANTITVSSLGSSENQRICTKAESSPNNTKATKVPPTLSICIPATTSSTNEDLHTEIDSPPSLMQDNTQGYHTASPSPSICGPATTPSPKPDFWIEIESPPIFTKNQTELHTATAEIERIDSVLDTTDQTFRNFNLPTSSKDIQRSTATITSSRKQTTDVDSSPGSQMNSAFWGFYFLVLFSFFYFFWGNVMRIFVIAIFLSTSFPWKNWNTGGKKERTAKNSTTLTEIQRKEDDRKMDAVTKYTPTVTSSRDQNTGIVSQMNSYFWVAFFLFLFVFFAYIWGYVVMCLSITFFVLSLFLQQNGKNDRKAGSKRNININE